MDIPSSQQPFVATTTGSTPWVQSSECRGAEAVLQAHAEVPVGHIDPRQGLVSALA